MSAYVEISMLKWELARITEERDHYLRERTSLIEQHENCRLVRQSLLDVLNAMVDWIRGRDNESVV